MVQSPSPSSLVLYVNPNGGNDSAGGGQGNPFKTITRALRQAASGTTIRLAPGTYSVASGEVFPLVVPAGVALVGNEASKGNGIVIDGNGEFVSPTFNRQNVTLQLDNGTQLRGITVVNRAARGTGVWIESTNPTIANSTFTNCGREGIFATGNALPDISDNVFQRNAASGISIVRNAKGIIQRNICQNTGYGIAISDNAAPLLIDNQVIENRAGIVISGAARPVLRSNQIDRNTGDGLTVMNNAVPDLGKSQDPGGNSFQGNQGVDLRNTTPTAILSVGNQINPTRINGLVNFIASEVPPRPIAGSTPAPIASPVPSPLPAPVPVPPVGVPTPSPATGGRLADISGFWAEPFIRGLVERGIITGFPDNTFKPQLRVTRAQYAAAIAKAFNLPAKRQGTSFRDVPADFWATGAIIKSVQMAFIAGFPDGTFRPTQNLTRVQAIVSLVSGLGLTGSNPNSLDVYSDRVQIPSYAVNAVAIATQRRIVVNYPRADRLDPLVDITRAEIAAMIYQSLVAIGQAPAVVSPFVIQPNTSVPSFADIQEYWAEAFIRGLASQGFISGFADGTFKPDAAMTRAQYAVLLANAFNPAPQRDSVSFTDVPDNFWAAAAIQRAYRGGLLSGVGDGIFQPNQNVSRVQVLLALASGLNLPAANLNLLNLYDDQAEIPAFARDAVARVTAQRLVVNFPQVRQLDPNRAATRAEVAAIVYQAMVYLRRSSPIGFRYIVDPGSQAAVSQSLTTKSPPPTPAVPVEADATTPPATRVVAIDPSYGIGDQSAIGREGLTEKDVVLPIAQDVAALLQQRGFQVVMTRNDDRYPDLDTRIQVAEQAKAGVFISIHANALSLNHPEINGLETYHYRGSARGASLAQAIQNTVLHNVNIQDRGVREADLYILKNTSMPAALIKVGFITGQNDAPNLAQPDYRNRLAQAIANGILQYVSGTGG